MKYALITGANSGLGNGATKELLNKGYTVFACDINIDNLHKSNKLIPIKVDVTKDNQLDKAYKIVRQHTDRLDIIGNFVGVVLMGGLIEKPVDTLLKTMDLNVGSMYRVSQKFFDMLKKAKGRIINISSEVGNYNAIPFNNFYTMSKHAVEVYNDGLRQELLPFKIKVIKIRPDSFKTNMEDDIEKQYQEIKHETSFYKNAMEKMERLAEKEFETAKPVDVFVETFIQAVTDKRPKKCYETNKSSKKPKNAPKKMDNYYKDVMKNKKK